MIEVLAFGIVKDIFGATVLPVDADGKTVAAFKNQLENDYPRLQQLASYIIAINNEYAQDGYVIHANDEIAIIPPVSGG